MITIYTCVLLKFQTYLMFESFLLEFSSIRDIFFQKVKKKGGSDPKIYTRFMFQKFFHEIWFPLCLQSNPCSGQIAQYYLSTFHEIFTDLVDWCLDGHVSNNFRIMYDIDLYISKFRLKLYEIYSVSVLSNSIPYFLLQIPKIIFFDTSTSRKPIYIFLMNQYVSILSDSTNLIKKNAFA